MGKEQNSNSQNFTEFVKTEFKSSGENVRFLYTKASFEEQIEAFENADKSAKASIREELKRMFNDVEATLPNGDLTPADFRDALSPLPEGTLAKDNNELNIRILKAIQEIYLKCPTPKAIIKRILDNCGDKAFKNEPSIRLRILKEFIKNGSSLLTTDNKLNLNPKYQGLATIKKYCKDNNIQNILDVDDGVFDLIKHATDEQRKKTYRLLFLADEIAEGRFRRNGASKEPIYWLALILKMKYFPDYSTEIDASKNETKDKINIEKNFFEDYYHENFIRFLIKDSNKSPIEYDSEPKRDGINYKNYAEAIFLYYLNYENEDITPNDKIKKIRILLEDIKKEITENKDKYLNKNPDENTNEYESPTLILKGKIDDKDSGLFCCREEELKEYILNNFDCSIIVKSNRNNDKTHCVNPFEVISPSTRLPDVMEEATPNIADYSKYTNNSEDDIGYLSDNIEELTKGNDFKKEFRDIIKNVLKILEKQERIDNSNVTRSILIANIFHYYFYYTYNNIKENSGLKSIHIEFNEFLDDAVDSFNYFLEEAGYSKINYKNVFDVLVLFLEYYVLNNKIKFDENDG